MLHLAFCISIWTSILTFLCWRFIAIAKMAVRHLQRLHEIPCNKCTYFTGDYRLKCTVNPTIAMSETAIGCRDFLYDTQAFKCKNCMVANQCDSNANKEHKNSLFKRKLTYLK